jgi:hypothetical protein
LWTWYYQLSTGKLLGFAQRASSAGTVTAEDGGEAVRDYGLDLVPWPRETTPAMTSTPTAWVNILDVVMYKPELRKSSTNS